MSSNNNDNIDFVIVGNIRNMNLNNIPTSLSSSVDDAWDNWEKAFSEEKYLDVSINNGISTVLTSNLTPEMTAGYNRSCGAAFGNLSKHLKLQINGNGPFAIGVGVSLDPKTLNDPNPPINGSITLRSGETEIRIE
jgi:hypothetical protein